MERLVLVALLALAPFMVDADKGHKKFQIDPEIKEACMTQSGITEDSFKEARKDHSKFRSLEFRCFWECVSLKTGTFNEEGEPDMDVIKKKMENFNIDDIKLTETVHTCHKLHKDKTGECEKIPAIGWCIYKSFRKDHN